MQTEVTPEEVDPSEGEERIAILHPELIREEPQEGREHKEEDEVMPQPSLALLLDEGVE